MAFTKTRNIAGSEGPNSGPTSAGQPEAGRADRPADASSAARNSRAADNASSANSQVGEETGQPSSGTTKKDEELAAQRRRRVVVGVVVGVVSLGIIGALCFGGSSNSSTGGGNRYGSALLGGGALQAGVDVWHDLQETNREALSTDETAFTTAQEEYSAGVSTLAESSNTASSSYNAGIIASSTLTNDFYAMSNESKRDSLAALDQTMERLDYSNEQSVAAHEKAVTEFLAQCNSRDEKYLSYLDRLASREERIAALNAHLVTIVCGGLSGVDPGTILQVQQAHDKAESDFCLAYIDLNKSLTESMAEILNDLDDHLVGGPQMIFSSIANVKVNDINSTSTTDTSRVAWQSLTTSYNRKSRVLGFNGSKSSSSVSSSFESANEHSTTALSDHSVSFSTEVTPYGGDLGAVSADLYARALNTLSINMQTTLARFARNAPNYVSRLAPFASADALKKCAEFTKAMYVNL